jgi:transcriptional regulator with XRE-family HTH domain
MEEKMKKLKLKSDYNFKEMGRRIQQRRKEMKLTQEELSALTGISVSMISSAERGSRHFSIEAFVAVCEVLKASPDYFLLGSLHGYNLPENIMDNLKLLRPDDVEFIMQSINLLIERNKEGNISEHYLEKLKN